MKPWKTEIRKKTLKNGATVILIRKPDYVQSFFLCGFGTGGFNVRERSRAKRFKTAPAALIF